MELHRLGTPAVNHLRSVYVPWFSIWLYLRCWLYGNMVFVLEVDGLGVGVFGAQFGDLDAEL